MMEELIKTAISQVPALSVLALIVMVFLKHMRERDEAISAMNAENLEARAHSRSVIERNSEIVGHNSRVCEEMTSTMRDLIHRMEQNQR